jgi:hypothetical protein
MPQLMRQKYQEIPNVAQELIEMSTQYLKQETIEPAKRLGRHAGMGVGGAVLMALGAFLALLGVYNLMLMVLPQGEWWIVLARGITAVVAAAGAGLVIWRMGESGDDNVDNFA